MAAREPSLAGLARLRQGTYRLLSALLLYPEAERLAVAPRAARHLRASGHLATRLAFFEPWDSLWRRVARLQPARMARLQAIYSRLFIGNGARPPVSVCESGYLDSTSQAAVGQMLGKVEAAYAAAGLRSVPAGVAADHAAVELEFLSFLCGQEAAAWEAQDAWRARGMLRRQRLFLDEHLYRWLPLLGEAVGARDARGLYALVTRTAWALVAHDADFVGALEGRLEAKPANERSTPLGVRG